ncbi:uncharacterized protein UHOD_06571 [Ustilago sp. UG-2017b]|nr:uncharacterized protein UHOD_06571 [Ustilago sp. UG-2017b]
MSPGKKSKTLFAGEAEQPMQDRDGFAYITVTTNSSPRQWQKVLEHGWVMTITYGKGDSIFHVSLAKKNDAIDCIFEVVISVEECPDDGQRRGIEMKRKIVRLDAGLDSVSFTISIAEEQKQAEQAQESREPQTNNIIDFSYQIRQHDAVPKTNFVTPPGLVDAIAKATVFGTWGDTCFVVLSRKADNKYACVYGDRVSLQAHGATELLRHIDNNGFSTLEAALCVLTHRDAWHLPEPKQPLGKFVPISGMAVTTVQAVLLYLQTRHITFGPLESTRRERTKRIPDGRDESMCVEGSVDVKGIQLDQEEASQAQQHLKKFSGMITTSPKSIYRAACKLGLTELKELAYTAINNCITPANVLHELFDDFALKHEEIQQKLLDYTLAHWEEIKRQDENGVVDMFGKRGHRIGAPEVIRTIIHQTEIKKQVK